MGTSHFSGCCSSSICAPGLGSFFVRLHQLAFAVDQGFDTLYAAWVLGNGQPARHRRHHFADRQPCRDYIRARMGRDLHLLGVSIARRRLRAVSSDGPGPSILLLMAACLPVRYQPGGRGRGPAVTAKDRRTCSAGRSSARIPRRDHDRHRDRLGDRLPWGAGWIFDVLGAATGSPSIASIVLLPRSARVALREALRRPPARRAA